jgi:hypothetical protein
MYPRNFVPLPIPLLPLSTLFPWSKLRLNMVYTLSYIFPILQMVMNPRYPLPFTSHPYPPFVPPLLPRLLYPSPPSPAKSSIFILQCLCTLVSMHGRKNILKKLDYDTLQIEEVNFLPPRFDGNCMFVLPLVGILSSHTNNGRRGSLLCNLAKRTHDAYYVNLYSLENYRVSLICSVLKLTIPLFSL